MTGTQNFQHWGRRWRRTPDIFVLLFVVAGIARKNSDITRKKASELTLIARRTLLSAHPGLWWPNRTQAYCHSRSQSQHSYCWFWVLDGAIYNQWTLFRPEYECGLRKLFLVTIVGEELETEFKWKNILEMGWEWVVLTFEAADEISKVSTWLLMLISIYM